VAYSLNESQSPVSFAQEGTQHTIRGSLAQPTLEDLQNLTADVNNVVAQSGTARKDVGIALSANDPQITFSWNTLP